MFQWWGWRSRFLWSISYFSLLPHHASGCLNWFTPSTLEHLSTWKTFCYHLDFHCGYNRLRHCICVDKTKTSRCRVPFQIQVHPSSFWNHCYWATCLHNHFSLVAIRGYFMFNPDRRGTVFVQQIYQLVHPIWLADIPIRSISSILFKGIRRQR